MNGTKRINAERYLLLGNPVAHSISPEIHRFLFRLTGRDHFTYEAKNVPPHELKGTVESLRGKVAGFNCTIPHKEAIIPLIDELDDRAALLRSVNTVADQNGVTKGYNTDVDGFFDSLALNGFDVVGKKVLFVGTGGSAKALSFETANKGAEVTIAGRDLKKAQQLAERISLNLHDTKIGWVSLSACSGSFDLLVNCTPAGMFPSEYDVPVELSRFERIGCVFDLIYNPTTTALLRDAKKMSIPTIGGISMLVIQAIKAQEIWMGIRYSDEEKQMAIDFAKNIIVKRRMQDKYGKDNLILTGFMGSGKSTIGKHLAVELGMDFLDLDEKIERSAGCTISEIFRMHGEEYFRELEYIEAQKLKGLHHCVIAGGGGSVTIPRTANALREAGIIIFLDAAVEKIIANLSDGIQKRPLLTGENPLEAITELYHRRYPIYQRESDLSVDASGKIAQISREIIDRL